MARRLGGEDVRVVVRSPRADMKASPWEIEDALAEGIPVLDNHQPLECVVEGGRLVGMRFARVRAEYDQRGGRRLIPLDEEPVFLPCDEVLIAIGQENAFPWIEKECGLAFNERGLPVVDPRTMESSRPGIFFGGDAAFGPANVITAVAHGHQAAISIDLFCRGRDLQERPAPQVSLLEQQLDVHDWLYDSQVSVANRQAVPRLPQVKSLKDRLLEVELGFDVEGAYTEAQRCLNCDIQTVFEGSLCIECDACVDICPTSCLNFVANGREGELRQGLRIPARNVQQPLFVSAPLATGRVMVKDENVCLHCGLCAERCPTAAWKMLQFLYHDARAGE